MIRNLRRDHHQLTLIEELSGLRRHVFERQRLSAEVMAEGGEIHAFVNDHSAQAEGIQARRDASIFAGERPFVTGFGHVSDQKMIVLTVWICEKADGMSGFPFEDSLALHELAL